MIEQKCRGCDNLVTFVKKKLTHYNKRGGKFCKKCLSKMFSETMKKTKSLETPEQKKEANYKSQQKRTKEGNRQAVLKQWETIKSDPIKYKEFRKARSERMKKVWKEDYSQDQKNHILTTLVASNNCGRSKLSDDVKSKLIESGLYEGFISEECFHGFFPDEINHDLKLIIEVYGDIYHCNPKTFKDETLFLKYIQRTVGEQWQRDRIRLACFYKHGYKVLIIWEADWYRNPQKEIERARYEIEKCKENQQINEKV